MVELRGRAAKRQKIDGGSSTVVSCEAQDGKEEDDAEDGHGSDCAGPFDILEELDEHPDIVQVVATAGGLITHCK